MIIQEDLILLGKLRLRWGNSYIDVLDSEGNLNARVKNIIKSGRPSSNSNDGFYCDGSKTYIKFGSQIFTIGGISESNLPSGSILMYLGSTPPDGWYEYERPTGLNDTIYIINKLGTTPEKTSVLLLWIYNGSPTNLVNAKLGLSNDFPSLFVSPSAANGTRTYSSSNTSVATISSSGNVNIRNIGTTIITCLMEETSLYKGASASYTLNVSLDKEEVTLDWIGSVETMGTLSIILNESFTTPVIRVNGTSLNQTLFKLNYVSYTSFNTNVATVSKNSSGDLILNPIGVGTSIIMARCEDSDDHTEDTSIFTLEVSERLKTNVILSSNNYTVSSDSGTLTPTIGITGGSLNNVYIEELSDPSNVISSISNRILNLTGNTGQATLRAVYPEDSTHNLAIITFTVTVESSVVNVSSVSINTPSTTILLNGESVTLTAGITPSNATNKSITWFVYSNSLAVTLNQDGLNCTVIANEVDSDSNVTIVAQSVDGNKTDSVQLTVKATQQEEETPIESSEDISLYSWAKDNYIVDTVIDSYFVNNYNMGSVTIGDSSKAGWDTLTNKAKKEYLTYVAILPDIDDIWLFTTNYVQYTGIETDVNHESSWISESYNRYNFTRINSSQYSSSDLNKFKIEGPFADLGISNLSSDKNSDIRTLLNIVRIITDRGGRDPMFNLNRGRTRPLSDPTSSSKTPRKTQNGKAIVGHPLNSIVNYNLLAIVEYNNINEDTDSADCNNDGPTSYPSGHSSQVWGMAMMLLQIYCNDLSTGLKCIRNAYKFGVGRTTGRFHWNSDTMYGRLCTTMMMPIINAVLDFRNIYEESCNSLNTSGHNNSLPTDSNYSTAFNNMLNLFSDIVSISDSVKKYLWSMYKVADNVLSQGSSHDFLKLSTYPEVFPQSGYRVNIGGEYKTVKYRGNNTNYYYGDQLLSITRNDIMLSWLMAMCLSEIYFTRDSVSYTMNSNPSDLNIQTKLFARAYEIGGGRQLDLYHEYKIDYDPTILRLAAGLVYTTERGKYSFDTIRSLSSNTTGIYLGANINYDNAISINSSLGCSGSDSGSYTVGYGINNYYIFNDRPGPHSNYEKTSTINPYLNKSVGTNTLQSQHQHESLFFTSSGGSTTGGSASMTPCTNGGSSGSGSLTISTSPININVHNNSSTTFTFYYIRFEFTDGTETGGIDGTMGTVAAGQTLSFNNIILDEVKQSRLGKTLSTPSIKLTDYTDLSFNNFSGQIFNGGLTYDIYYGDSTPSTTSGGGSSGGDCNLSTITITNNTGSTLNLENRIRFILSDNSRSGNITLNFDNGQESRTLNNGSSCTATFDCRNASGYGTNFRDMSTPIKFNGDYYTTNIILYSIDSGALFNTGILLSSTLNLTNGTYEISLGGGSSGGGGDTPIPSGDSVNITLNITNNSSATISCTKYSKNDNYGRMSIMSYGLHPSIGSYYYYRPKGRCNVWSLAPGESTTVNVLFSKEIDPEFETWMIGYLLCSKDQAEPIPGVRGRHSNIAFYSNGTAIRLKALPDTSTFSNGVVFTTEYNNDIHNAPGYYNDDNEWIPGYEWTGGYWV